MTHDGTITARTERAMEARPEAVFDAWLDPDTIRAWMPRSLRAAGLEGDVRTVRVDPREGGSHATIEHEMSAEWASYVESVEAAWHRMLMAVDEELAAAR